MPFLNFISAQLEQLGLQVNEVVNDTCVRIDLVMDSYQSSVLIISAGRNDDGHTILKLVSEGFKLTDDERIDGPMAILFLRRNSTMTSAHWEIVDLDSEPNFLLASTLIANTMDSAELHEALRSMVAERRAMAKEMQKHSIDF